MIALSLALLVKIGGTINECEFAFHYEGSQSNQDFGNHADYDITTDKYYMTRKWAGILLQFDATGTVLNSIEIENADINGVLVFSTGGRVWIYGTQGMIIAFNDDFTVALNWYFAGRRFRIGTTDGNGHAYFVVESSSTILKVRESDFTIVFEQEFDHISPAVGEYFSAWNIYASATALLFIS